MESVICIAFIALLAVKVLILQAIMMGAKRCLRRADGTDGIEAIIYFGLLIAHVLLFCYLVSGLTMRLVSIVNSNGVIWA
jgi:hypothetical protein